MDFLTSEIVQYVGAALVLIFAYFRVRLSGIREGEDRMKKRSRDSADQRRKTRNEVNRNVDGNGGSLDELHKHWSGD